MIQNINLMMCFCEIYFHIISCSLVINYYYGRVQAIADFLWKGNKM